MRPSLPVLALPLLALALAAPLGALAPLAERAQEPAAPATARVERRLACMGTWLALEVEAADRPTALAASEAAVRALEAVEARLSTWRPESELSRLNRAPAGEPFAIGPALEADLRAARRWSERTGGAFDPGIGALVQAWGLREGGRRPGPEALEAAVGAGGIARLELRPGLAVRPEGLALEEGAFGKGVGLDAALAAVRAAGGRAARLDLGGQVAALGEALELELAHPDERGRAVLALRVDGGSLATSGNSERGLVVDGERLGHLLDPRTGRPAPDFGSLTVLATDATAADCLSTALYVLGPDRALAFARAHEGVEVLVLERGAGGLRARASAGWRGRARPLVHGLELELAAPTDPAPSAGGADRPAWEDAPCEPSPR